MSEPSAAVRRVVEAVWRMEGPRLLGGLVRLAGDVGLAEEWAQEAMLAALEKWSEQGIPDNPGAWLTTTARRRALDELRRRKMQGRKHEELDHELRSEQSGEVLAEERVGEIEDDVLRLLFTACHPVLSREARIALTLRLLAGLTTEQIARAFLTSEPTVAQRIVRAKRTLAEAKVPFELPRGSDLESRLGSVLEVIYLVFNEGYAATRGDDWMRLELCEEALRLGRMLAALHPEHSEVHGLVALLELQASRLRARVGPDGEPILLLDQDRSRWDWLLVERGLASLERAEECARQAGVALGPYALQAAIASCHARARTVAETDWVRMVALYDALLELTGSPVVELNRAVAVSMAFGAEAALEIVDRLVDEPALRSYHVLPAVRADLLKKLGRIEEARIEIERAAFLTKNSRERALLLSRARELAASS